MSQLYSLVERLREPRVRATVEPMLAGQALGDVPADDRQLVARLEQLLGGVEDFEGTEQPVSRKARKCLLGSVRTSEEADIMT